MRHSLIILSAALCLQQAFALDAPDAQLEVVGGTFTLSWSAVTGADGYTIYSMMDAYGTGTLLAEVGPEVLSYDVSGGNPFFYVTTVSNAIVPGPAPVPDTHLDEDVISIFSDSYVSLEGTDFNPWWWQSTLTTIEDLGGGNAALKYANFNYQGTQFASAQDLTLMEYLHIDMWTMDEAAVNAFVISASPPHETPFALTPILAGEWNSYEIPLSYFTDLGITVNDIHQFKFDGGTGGTIYLDNLYFWKNPTLAGTDATLSDLLVDDVTVDDFASLTFSYDILLPYGSVDVPVVTAVTTDVEASYLVYATPSLPGTTEVEVTAADDDTILSYYVNFLVADATPLVAAPVPTVDPGTVLSIYSDAYTNLADSNFNPWWGQSTAVTVDHQVAGDNTLLYETLNYQGTNLGHFDGADQDVSAYGFLHMDFWSPNYSDFEISLISRSSGEYAYPMTGALEQWNSVEIPLAFYHDLGLSLEDIYQFKVSAPGEGWGNATVYIDNWYFHGESTVIEDPVPVVGASDPTYPAGNVISMFSNVYTDIAVGTWSADWDQANLSDILIAGNDTKLYENLFFAGIEGFTVDASAMTHFRLDFWTPDNTELPAVFKIKLVDFGGDGWGGGNDTEYELVIDASYATPLSSENWVSFDLPLTEWPGMNFSDISQLIISGDPGTVYIDNVLFHN